MLKVLLPFKQPLVISLLVLGVLVAGSVPSYYFYNQYQKTQALLKNPTEAARQEVQALTLQVGKYIELPSEEPTVATVSDKDKLKEQAFFAHAKNGDKVLIYTQARKAILFRPSTNKIIEVSTVNIGGVTGEATASGSVTHKPTVALLNGTNVVGLTKTVERQLLEKGVNVEVVSKENAKKQDYTKTKVIDLTNTQKEVAEQLAKLLNGEVGSLPEGETRPANADLLVILGK